MESQPYFCGVSISNYFERISLITRVFNYLCDRK